MLNPNSYIEEISNVFSKNGNEKIANEQAKYLKNRFDFYGIKSPERKQLIKVFFVEEGIPELSKIEEVIKLAYQYPQREMHYFAVELTEKQCKYFNIKHLRLIRWMIEHNSWWDTVDLIASHIVGSLVKKFPDLFAEMDLWIKSSNYWVQRSVLLFQLGYKENTDVDRLFHYCTLLAQDREFFIRKAIGWALRQYSKTNPIAVKKFVTEQPLSNLSKKEALKYIEK